MATRPTLPFFAPAEDLPAPLPTVAEILASKKLLSQSGEQPVVHINKHYAVKYGYQKILREGENLLFVQQSTSIPVPKIYAVFHDKATDKCFLVQEYIPGKMLRYIWNKLSETEKEALVSQLRQNMDELRSIPSPGYYGGLWGQPISNYFLGDGKTPIGPYKTEKEWVEDMWRRLGTAVQGRARGYLKRFRRFYHKAFKGHKPVFTHGDFFHNIMVRDDNGQAVIIDWERAGWAPSYWEYCREMVGAGEDMDWGDMLHKVLDEHIAELGWMIQIRGTLSTWGC